MEGGFPLAVLRKQEHTVAASNVPVCPPRHDRIGGWRTTVLREINCARILGQPGWIRRIRPTIAAHGIERAVARLSRDCSRRAVVQVKHQPIKPVRRGTGPEDFIDILQGLGCELRAGQNYLRKAVRKYQTHTLRIKKEKQLVFFDWATQRTRPLMGDIRRAYDSWRVPEPVVGI